MEEFDQYIKTEIESLNKVPGISFDEQGVWNKVISKKNGNLMLPTVSIFLITVLIALLFLPKENQEESAAINFSEESNSMRIKYKESDLVENVMHQESHNAKEIDLNTKSDVGLLDSLEDEFNESPELLEETEEDPYESSSSSHLFSNLQHEKKLFSSTKKADAGIREEFSFMMGKKSQTIGITHLRRLDNRFTFSYGIQYRWSRNDRMNISETLDSHFELHQIQIPIGLRYDLREEEGWFNPFLYIGLQNSFNTKSIMLDYNMMFESKLGADFRIFSTDDGKKGYLRFKIPLYNKSIINQGFYQPTLYDALK